MADSYTKKSEYGLIDEGAYECVLETATIGQTPNGTDKIDLKFRIRADIEQKFKGRYIFDTIWKDKTNPNLFDTKKINKLLGTQRDIKEGETFNTIEDVIKVLNGALMIVNVKTGFNEYYGEDRNYIAYYTPTKVVVQGMPIVGDVRNSVSISEDDLPF